MAHALQERYSALVLAKLRKDLVLKDGIVFNNDYEGNPKAGAVKIPVRDTEVVVGDYDKATGIAPGTGTTTYTSLAIDKDKAVNEIIDGYDTSAVPDGIIAERLDSAGYSLAAQIDSDGSAELKANGSIINLAQVYSTNIYEAVVDIRTAMSKANVPNDGKRYLLVTPDAYAMMLKDKDNFIRQGDMAQVIKETGAIGQYAGFNLYEMNDTTTGLLFIAGHPKFATRVNEWSVPVGLVDLSGDSQYIGASALKGRMVYAHKVLRSSAINVVYAPALLTVSAAEGSTSGKTILTVTAGQTDGSTLKYRVAPSAKAVFGQATSSGFTALTSGTTEITATAGTIIEVVEVDADAKVVKAGYAESMPKA